jgi:hypothetical protein
VRIEELCLVWPILEGARVGVSANRRDRETENYQWFAWDSRSNAYPAIGKDLDKTDERTSHPRDLSLE